MRGGASLSAAYHCPGTFRALRHLSWRFALRGSLPSSLAGWIPCCAKPLPPCLDIAMRQHLLAGSAVARCAYAIALPHTSLNIGFLLYGMNKLATTLCGLFADACCAILAVLLASAPLFQHVVRRACILHLTGSTDTAGFFMPTRTFAGDVVCVPAFRDMTLSSRYSSAWMRALVARNLYHAKTGCCWR